MTAFQVRRLTIREISQAKKNVALFWKTTPDTKTISHFLANPQNILLAAEIAGEPAGQLIGYTLGRWDRDQPMLFLFSLDVAENHRRQGIATALIEAFKQIGKDLGCAEAFVFTNEQNYPAMRLYEFTGGTRTHPDDVMFEYELL